MLKHGFIHVMHGWLFLCCLHCFDACVLHFLFYVSRINILAMYYIYIMYKHVYVHICRTASYFGMLGSNTPRLIPFQVNALQESGTWAVHVFGLCHSNFVPSHRDKRHEPLMHSCCVSTSLSGLLKRYILQPFETCCFFHQDKGKPPFTRQCSMHPDPGLWLWHVLLPTSGCFSFAPERNQHQNPSMSTNCRAEQQLLDGLHVLHRIAQTACNQHSEGRWRHVMRELYVTLWDFPPSEP